MIDFHTHVLHGIDDGAVDLDMSIAMLEEAYASGTEVVVVSPHFYPRRMGGIDYFLQVRDKKYNELKQACKGRAVPKLLLGAEVNISDHINELKNFHDLCIEGTDYMLMEMPFVPWEEWMIECIYNLTVNGIKPIMVHIDRYMHYPKAALAALNELNPLYQISSEALLSHIDRKIVFDLFKEGRAHVLGSDMHNLRVRKNTLSMAYEQLKTRFGEEYLEYIEVNGNKILQNRMDIETVIFNKAKKSRLFI